MSAAKFQDSTIQIASRPGGSFASKTTVSWPFCRKQAWNFLRVLGLIIAPLQNVRNKGGRNFRRRTHGIVLDPERLWGRTTRNPYREMRIPKGSKYYIGQRAKYRLGAEDGPTPARTRPRLDWFADVLPIDMNHPHYYQVVVVASTGNDHQSSCEVYTYSHTRGASIELSDFMPRYNYT